ncbi:hypothetical protein CANCADRAFT_148563 [Tortispora caseinolytica NRRL Y-17796]|uniref:Uncharacterized protein n=1 Tax=Tortispora caseinolytica NRRL Y-17796 TaxID=767744 RepID=A0A1E4TCY8_9ASCO|nr:hypothetical protein CANCADRAFT_148563 [Tortispora caseinolytica NRRL Y-17796]
MALSVSVNSLSLQDILSIIPASIQPTLETIEELVSTCIQNNWRSLAVQLVGELSITSSPSDLVAYYKLKLDVQNATSLHQLDDILYLDPSTYTADLLTILLQKYWAHGEYSTFSSVLSSYTPSPLDSRYYTALLDLLKQYQHEYTNEAIGNFAFRLLKSRIYLSKAVVSSMLDLYFVQDQIPRFTELLLAFSSSIRISPSTLASILEYYSSTDHVQAFIVCQKFQTAFPELNLFAVLAETCAPLLSSENSSHFVDSALRSLEATSRPLFLHSALKLASPVSSEEYKNLVKCVIHAKETSLITTESRSTFQHLVSALRDTLPRQERSVAVVELARMNESHIPYEVLRNYYDQLNFAVLKGDAELQLAEEFGFLCYVIYCLCSSKIGKRSVYTSNGIGALFEHSAYYGIGLKSLGVVFEQSQNLPLWMSQQYCDRFIDKAEFGMAWNMVHNFGADKCIERLMREMIERDLSCKALEQCIHYNKKHTRKEKKSVRYELVLEAICAMIEDVKVSPSAFKDTVAAVSSFYSLNQKVFGEPFMDAIFTRQTRIGDLSTQDIMWALSIAYSADISTDLYNEWKLRLKMV